MTPKTLLLRQVNPSWLQQGRVTSQVFRPTPKDQFRPSAYDGDQITAEKAWEHFTAVMGFPSVGVMAVSVQECKTQELPVTPDPNPFPQHVLIDFTGLKESEIRKKSKLLKMAAESRGWQYQAKDGM
jgi:hypothetical protein